MLVLTIGAEPVSLRNVIQRRIQTSQVIGPIGTTVLIGAYQHVVLIAVLAAALLALGVFVTDDDIVIFHLSYIQELE